MERQDWDTIQSTPGRHGTAVPVLTTVLSDLTEHLLNPRGVEDMSMPPATPEFWKRMNQVERERSLFVTESRGYLGCGPAALEPGDEVWLLLGATVPFVLRPIAHGDIIQRFEASDQVVELFELPNATEGRLRVGRVSIGVGKVHFPRRLVTLTLVRQGSLRSRYHARRGSCL